MPDVPRVTDPKSAVAAALDRLALLHPKRIDLSLNRLHRLLAALGNPERRLPPVIHVAGTNGKGSTLAFQRAMLEATGRKVHAYTSPHLVRFNERIMLAGSEIADNHLADVLDRCEAANGEAPITFFEVTTAAAFLAFAETPADILLLEVGLGGRLDATNVVDAPQVTAITRVSTDHTEFLGNTLAEIAGEKAGIAKPGVPLVVGPQVDPIVVDTICARAGDVGAQVHVAGRDWTIEPQSNGFAAHLGARTVTCPWPGLPGAHQIDNAATAVASLGFVLSDAELAGAAPSIASARWPARLQRLTAGPLVEVASQGTAVWLDGGHNDSAGAALGTWLAEYPERPVAVIAGMLSTKDPSAFLRPLAAHAERLIAVPVRDSEAGIAPEALARVADAIGFERVETAPSAQDAARRVGTLEPPAMVLICGSLYLAGEVLEENR